MAKDLYGGLKGPNLGEGPYDRAFVITPHDTNELELVTRAVWVGTGGHLNVTTMNGDEVQFDNVPNGTLMPIRVKIVKTAVGGASDIVGLT